MSDDFDREERAFIDALRGAVADEGFRPLDPEAVKPVGRRRASGPWVRTLAAAAAVVVVAGAGALVLPRLASGGLASTAASSVEAFPAAGAAQEDRAGAAAAGGEAGSVPVAGSPTGVGEWVQTAPSPLSGRRDAASTWYDGRFYLVGGWAGEPCPPNASCLTDGDALVDAASYDPAADVWLRIADAPVKIAGEDPVAVAGQLFFRSAAGEPDAIAAYEPASDTWRRLEDPDPKGRLVAAGDTLLSVTQWTEDAQRAIDYRYDGTTGRWVELPADPWGSSASREAVWLDGRVLFATRAHDPTPKGVDLMPLRLAELDLATMTWTVLGERDVAHDGLVTANELAVWPYTGETRAEDTGAARDWRSGAIYDPATDSWSQIPDVEGKPYGVESADGTVAAGQVVVHTHLLDPRTGSVTRLDAPPSGNRQSPTVVGGPTGILVFGGRAGQADTAECWFLPVG